MFCNSVIKFVASMLFLSFIGISFSIPILSDKSLISLLESKNMKSGVLIKIHESAGKHIVAAADKELIGKKFKEGEICLDVSERFYNGEEKTEDEIIKIFKDSTNINIVGEKSVALGIKAGIITEESVIKIQGIPHAISIQ